MDPAADLGAGADQRVGIDHGFLADPGAHVDIHRRHQGDPRTQVGASSNRRAAGNHSDARGRVPQVLERIGALVAELEVFIDREVRHRPQPEPQQDALFHPVVDLPPALLLLGGPDFSPVQAHDESLEQGAGFSIQLLGLSGKVPGDQPFQFSGGHGVANAGLPSARLANLGW